MIPFWKKTDKHNKPQSAQKRRQNAKPAVPRTAQQSISMQRMFEDGTYMAQPFYMEYETRYNKMQGCIDSYKQFMNIKKHYILQLR